MAILSALIAGGAAIAGAAISSKANKKAAKTAADTAAANNALQKQIYDKNVALSMPYINRGNEASDLIGAFLGMGGDPAKSRAALETFLNSSGYNFRFDEGVRAITGNRASDRVLNSGKSLRDLTTFGQGTAAQGAGDWLSDLFRVSNQGVGAIGAVTGAGTGYADRTSDNNNNAASASINAGLANSRNLTDLIGGLARTGIGMIGQSSYGSGSAGTPSGQPGITLSGALGYLG